MRRSRVLITLTVAVALFAGCSSEPSEVRRARQVLSEKMVESPEFQMYALLIMGGSSAPHARSMTLEAIAGENRQAGTEAIRGLGGRIDEEALAALHVAFGRRGAIKAQAAAVLAGEGEAEAIEWLAGQLGQGGYVLPVGAMVALAATEHEEAVRTSLRALIWSKDLSIRNEGYVILAEVKRPWSVSLLLEGLDKEFGEKRVGPIKGLGRSGDPSAAEAVRPWVRTQGLVLASLEALGSLADAGSLATVEAQLDDDEPLVRVYAAVAAWRLGATETATPLIESFIADEDAAVRAALAAQLGPAEGAEATGWLVRLAGDGDKDVRIEAYRGLIGRAGPGLAEQFAQGAQDEDYEVASVALGGLAETGNAAQAKALAPLLDSANPYLAISAGHAVLSLAAPGQDQAKVD